MDAASWLSSLVTQADDVEMPGRKSKAAGRNAHRPRKAFKVDLPCDLWGAPMGHDGLCRTDYCSPCP